MRLLRELVARAANEGSMNPVAHKAVLEKFWDINLSVGKCEVRALKLGREHTENIPPLSNLRSSNFPFPP